MPTTPDPWPGSVHPKSTLTPGRASLPCPVHGTWWAGTGRGGRGGAPSPSRSPWQMQSKTNQNKIKRVFNRKNKLEEHPLHCGKIRRLAQPFPRPDCVLPAIPTCRLARLSPLQPAWPSGGGGSRGSARRGRGLCLVHLWVSPGSHHSKVRACEVWKVGSRFPLRGKTPVLGFLPQGGFPTTTQQHLSPVELGAPWSAPYKSPHRPGGRRSLCPRQFQ